MSGIKINGVNLDWKAREVISGIYEDDGESDTSSVKEYTGLDREVVKYRFSKLEEAGLVETWQPNPSEGGRMPAKGVRLTEQGLDVIRDGDLELAVKPGGDELTLSDRVERLEKQNSRMRETYGQVKQRIVDMEDRLDELDSDIDDVARNVQRIVEKLEGK